jgi:hypothetical protein
MNVSGIVHLPTPTPVGSTALVGSKVAAPAQAASVSLPAVAVPLKANLSEQAAPVYQVLRAGATIPPSSAPGYVLPPYGHGFSQLFNAIQAIAVEHVYPAPVFSFSA